MSAIPFPFLGQYIGGITTPQGHATAMLCTDEDAPSEVMLHWWGDGITTRAILFDGKQTDESIELIPRLLFATLKNGSLTLVQHPTSEEAKFLAGLKVTIHIEGQGLLGDWVHANGQRGEISLRSSTKSREPKDIFVCKSWSDFKNWASRIREQMHCSAFRGHGNKEFHLRTSLNRAGKNRLDRYCANELIRFTSLVEGALELRLDLESQADYSTVLGLAQHHGMPTPLLDWTRSPYIAAFFAFSDALENMGNRAGLTHVRVYAMSEAFISTASPQSISVPFFAPYLNFMSISPRLNPRLSAQQGIFLITNVGNIEAFLEYAEEKSGVQYLHAVDIPIELISTALEDLSYMGLTPATMFPGLDGIGRMIRHEMLFKRQFKRLSTRAAAPGSIELGEVGSADGAVELSSSV